MKSILANTICGLSLLFALSLSEPAAAETVLKVASFTPKANTIFSCGVVPMLDELEALDDVKLEGYYGGGAFGNATQQYDQVARGIADMAFGISSYTEGQFPLTELITMPFAVDDLDSGARILNGVILPEFLGAEWQDVKGIHLWMTSLYQIHTRKALKDPTNLSGLRIRSAGDVHLAAMQALGAQVSFMPAPQIYENLQKGVLDGIHGNWTTTIAFKVAEVTKHHYVTNMGTSIGFTLMNKKTYEALPADAKAVVDKHSGTQASVKTSRCFLNSDGKAIELAKNLGNVIHELTPEQRRKMADTVAPVIEKRLAELEARGLPARAVYDRIIEERSK